MKTIHYLYLSIASFFLFFFLSIFIVNGSNLFFDFPVFTFLREFHITHFMKTITFLGEAKIIIPCLILSFFLFSNKKQWKFLIVMMLFEVSSNTLLKLFFGRERPNILPLMNETGYSFPSGHMMASTMFYGLLIYLVWQRKGSNLLKILITLILSLCIVIIGLSRIYLGVHYASDILGGFFFSMFLLTFGIFFFESMEKNVNKK